MASGWYQYGLSKVLDGTIDLDTSTLKMMLVTSSYTYDPDHTAVDAGSGTDLESTELNVTGYTRAWGGAGRKTATVTLQANNTNNRVDAAIADLTWTALGTGQTIGGAVLIKEGAANDTQSIPIAFFDLSDTATTGGDVTLDFTALGSGGDLRVAV